jgi:integrase
LLACFSGLRIDDILTLNQGELHKFYYERTQNKTKLPVLVTIHRHNERLFKKYIDGVGYTRQTLSAALKPLLKRSGLTKKVTRVQAVGFAFNDVVRAKYEEIAFHSGRRFYARLLNDLGCGGEIARDELGHSFKSITDLYAGSQEHNYRVARVRKAIESIKEIYEELALMKVA